VLYGLLAHNFTLELLINPTEIVDEMKKKAFELPLFHYVFVFSFNSIWNILSNFPLIFR
jgi:hypothetical protein